MADKAYFLAFLFSVFVTVVKAEVACTGLQYTAKSANGSSSCIDCQSCPEGQEVYPKCGSPISPNDLSECHVCQEGVTFSSNQDVWSCQTCSYCSEDQGVEKNCTISSDVVCAKQCKSQDKYYDDNGACMPCSGCCGDNEDVHVEECRQKLSVASNRVCSFHSSHNRCEGTTTASTTITDKKPSPDKPSTTCQPTELESSITIKPPTDPHVAFIAVGPILVVLFACWKIKQQRNRSNLDNERGNHSPTCPKHFSKVPTDDTANMRDGTCQVQIITDQSSLKRTQSVINLEEQMISQSTEPLVEKVKEAYKSSCHGSFDLQKDSKNLDSLFEDESALGEICSHLDNNVGNAGHYEAIAAYYKITFFERKTMEKSERGPSRSMFERLAATHPTLTIKEFIYVVKKETKRRDVVELLKKYDNSE